MHWSWNLNSPYIHLQLMCIRRHQWMEGWISFTYSALYKYISLPSPSITSEAWNFYLPWVFWTCVSKVSREAIWRDGGDTICHNRLYPTNYLCQNIWRKHNCSWIILTGKIFPSTPGNVILLFCTKLLGGGWEGWMATQSSRQWRPGLTHFVRIRQQLG